MKKLLFLLLFVCSAAFGQGTSWREVDFTTIAKQASHETDIKLGLVPADPMIRSIPYQLNGTCIQYAPISKAKSVVIILPGIGERGTDVTIIEKNIGVAKALKAGTFSVDRIILFQQIPSNVGGYYGNVIGPLIAYAQTFNLPIDFSGLSLGGMGVSLNLPFFKVRSAMTCPGNIEADKPVDKYGPAIYYDSAYKKIPSIHYYSVGDLTIANGYTSIKNLVMKLQSAGKHDITLIELPGSAHNVWDYAYSLANYWSWLDAMDAPVKSDPVITTVFDGTNIIETTQSGKVITIKPTTVN